MTAAGSLTILCWFCTRFVKAVHISPAPCCLTRNLFSLVSPDPAGEMDPSRCGSKVSGSGSIQLHRSKNLYRRFLADAAAGLSFSHDCVVDLGAGGVSYSRADFRPLFRPTGALKPSAKGRPQDRKLCRPAPRPKVQQAERFGDLLPVLEPPESLDQLGSELLQGSCGPARATAVSSADHHPKRASGSAKPVQKVAHRDHDHSTGDNSPKYHKNPQRWFSPGPQRRTGPAPDNSRSICGVSVKEMI